MKQKKAGGPPHAAVYVRVGSIQQLFRSNAEMVRHLFKELLEDGKEHSNQDICDYIFEKTNSRSVNGGRLTDEMIHSAIGYATHTTAFSQDRALRLYLVPCAKKVPDIVL